MKIERDLGAVVVADGRRAFGHLFLRDATDLAVDRAKQHGVALFSGKGSESAGRLADYCERAADAGVITLFFVNDSGGAQVVAPPGGLQPRMSTNPVAFGVPRSKPPHLVLDMATSTVANGRLSETKDRGEPVPEGWINPAGVLKHFGGVKGFGLAVIAEALAGALSGGGTVRADPSTEDQAFVLIAIDVRQIRALEDFTTDVEAFIAYIKDVELLPDAAPVRMPGEAKLQGVEAIRITGITVQPAILGRLREAVSSLGIELPASLAS